MAAESEKAKIGYARVSTTDQNLDMQVEALKRYGVHPDFIFTDTMSGGSMKRPGLKAALRIAQHMDTEFVVWKLDRLGRTMLGIIEVMKLFEDRGVRLVSITEGFDLGTPFGKAMVGMLAVFAEMERDLIRERTMAGLARARERGEVAGRPNAMTPERVEKAKAMLAQGSTPMQILGELREIKGPGISRARVYQWVKDMREIDPEDETDDR